MHGKELRELICAMLLGDGSLSDGGRNRKDKRVLFRVSHNSKQRDYCEWKMSLINDFFQRHNIDKRLVISDRIQKVRYLDRKYYVSDFNLVWSKLLPTIYDKCYPLKHGYRHKSYKYLLDQTHSPLHLAIWMGDDGNEDRSYSRSRVDGHKIPRSPRYRLAICSMTEGEINLTLEWFYRHFRLTPRVHYIKGKKYPILRFTVKQSNLIFNKIKPYICDIPSMRYKFRWSFGRWVEE